MKKTIFIIMLVFAMGLFSGCGEATEPTSGDSSGEVKQSAAEPTQNDILDQYVASAVETTLFTGTWTVGTDIPQGRYAFTVASGSGNFFIYDEDGNARTNEILCASGEEEDSMGVSKIIVYINEGEKIEISGLNDVLCAPTSSEISTSLCAGRYYVGHDVPSGSYIVTTPSGSGNFFVYDADGYPVTNEILCAPGEEDDSMGVSKVKVSLEENYYVEISGLNEVNFGKN